MSVFFAGQIWPLLEFIFLAASLDLIFQLPVLSARLELLVVSTSLSFFFALVGSPSVRRPHFSFKNLVLQITLPFTGLIFA
jgi:hypothetical protein